MKLRGFNHLTFSKMSHFGIKYQVSDIVSNDVYLKISQGKRRSDGALVTFRELDYHNLISANMPLNFYELEAHSKINHYAICRIEEMHHDQHRSRLFLVTEFWDNKTLADLTTSHKQTGVPVPEDLVWRILVHANEALFYYHSVFKSNAPDVRRILHRHITPQSIIMRNNGAVKIVHPEIPYLIAIRDHSNISPEEKKYVAPEVLGGKGFSDRSDIYALGCIIYQLCTLRNFADVFKNDISYYTNPRVSVPNPEPNGGRVYTSLLPNYSQELNEIVGNMTAFDETRRFTSNDVRNFPKSRHILDQDLGSGIYKYASTDYNPDVYKEIFTPGHTTDPMYSRNTLTNTGYLTNSPDSYAPATFSQSGSQLVSTFPQGTEVLEGDPSLTGTGKKSRSSSKTGRAKTPKDKTSRAKTPKSKTPKAKTPKTRGKTLRDTEGTDYYDPPTTDMNLYNSPTATTVMRSAYNIPTADNYQPLIYTEKPYYDPGTSTFKGLPISDHVSGTPDNRGRGPVGVMSNYGGTGDRQAWDDTFDRNTPSEVQRLRTPGLTTSAPSQTGTPREVVEVYSQPSQYSTRSMRSTTERDNTEHAKNRRHFSSRDLDYVIPEYVDELLRDIIASKFGKGAQVDDVLQELYKVVPGTLLTEGRKVYAPDDIVQMLMLKEELERKVEPYLNRITIPNSNTSRGSYSHGSYREDESMDRVSHTTYRTSNNSTTHLTINTMHPTETRTTVLKDRTTNSRLHTKTFSDYSPDATNNLRNSRTFSGDDSVSNDLTPLMRAAIRNDVDAVESSISEYGGYSNLTGNTALMMAASKNNYNVIPKLIPREAKIVDRDGLTALNYAAYYGHVESVKLLMDHEAGIQSNYGQTALMAACDRQHLNIVKLLKHREGGLVNNVGETALMRAVKAGNTFIVQELLDTEAGIRNQDGETALMLAAHAGNMNLCKALLSKEIGLQSKYGQTALMVAAQRNNMQLCELLIGREVNLKDNSEETALMKAARVGAVDAVRFLMNFEAGMKGRDGITALMIAAEEGHKDIVQLLIPREKMMVMRDGSSALMLAVCTRHLEVVKLLAPVESKMQKATGETAMIIAIRNKRPECARLLLEYEGSMKHNGMNVLQIADAEGEYALVEDLRGLI